MLTLSIVSQFIFEHFSKVTVSKNGTHFHARCVLCGDSKKSPSKKRFHLDFNDGRAVIFHCFNCDEAGTFLELYSKIKGISIAQAKKELNKYDVDDLTQRLSTRKRKKVLDEIEYEYHDYILDDCISECDRADGYIQQQYQRILIDFISERKIPEGTSLYIAIKGKFKNRIIIPVWIDGHITYFQARRIHESMEPKYKNPTLEKGSIIHNRDNFDPKKPVIVTEGLIDAFMIGKQGTSCLGAYISDRFIEELFSLVDKENVILAFDNDAPGMCSLVGFIEENKYANYLRYFLTPYKYKRGKDLNKLVILYNIDDMYNMIIENSYSYLKTSLMLQNEMWRKM